MLVLLLNLVAAVIVTLLGRRRSRVDTFLLALLLYHFRCQSTIARLFHEIIVLHVVHRLRKLILVGGLHHSKTGLVLEEKRHILVRALVKSGSAHNLRRCIVAKTIWTPLNRRDVSEMGIC